MNKTYRVVFNLATGTWTAVSELAKRRTKRPSRATSATAVITAGLLLASGGAASQTALPSFDPTINDHRVGSTVVSGGTNVTLVLGRYDG